METKVSKFQNPVRINISDSSYIIERYKIRHFYRKGIHKMKDHKTYQKIIIELVQMIQDEKSLERIYKLVLYLYTRKG